MNGQRNNKGQFIKGHVTDAFTSQRISEANRKKTGNKQKWDRGYIIINNINKNVFV